MAFSSAATNLVSGDINGAEDVFVRDRAASQTTLVSKTSDGLQGNNLSYKPAISADGRYVAFVTFASKLAPRRSMPGPSTSTTARPAPQRW